MTTPVRRAVRILVHRTDGAFLLTFPLNSQSLMAIAEEIQDIADRLDQNCTVINWKLERIVNLDERAKHVS